MKARFTSSHNLGAKFHFTQCCQEFTSKFSGIIQRAIMPLFALALCFGTMTTARAAGSTTALLDDDTWVDESRDSYEESETEKSKWVVLVSTTGTFTMPTGEYFTGVNPGFGVEGRIAVPVSKDIAIGGLVGTLKLPTDIDIIDFTSYQFALLLEGLLPSDNDKNVGYAGIGAGFTTLSFQDFSKTHFMIPARLGIVLWLSRDVGFDFGLGYNLILASGEDQYGNKATASASEIVASVGLTFGVQRKPKK